MYQQHLADPSSVDQAWHEFFADYRPGSPVSAGQDRAGEPAAPTPAAVPAATSYASPAPAREVTPQLAQSGGAAPTPAPAKPAAPAPHPAPADAEGSANRPSSPTVAPGAAPAPSRATPVDARSEG